jgi:hypothetical protein
MSEEDHTVSFSLEVNVEKAHENIRKLQTLLYRTLGLFRRLGLPEQIDSAIMKVQRFIAVMNQARLAAAAFQTAVGPIGWGLAIVGGLSTAVATADFMAELG